MSVVGILLYLVGISRPDITHAVHQCDMFSHNPKNSHEVGVKYIIRYLKGTKDKGLILSPDTTKLQLDLYADADFAGFLQRRTSTTQYQSKVDLA